MKLTSIKYGLIDLIGNSIYSECFDKTDSFYIWWKIDNEIWTSNSESISEMQTRMLNKLQDEINQSTN